MIRVALDVRVLDDPGPAAGGLGRYTRCLLDALTADGGELGVELTPLRDLRRPPLPARLAEGAEHVLLARDVRRTGAQVLHTPSIDRASLRPGVPLVVTLHDLVPLKRPERYMRTGLKHRLRYAAVRRATRVIVPAGSVAEDARRLLSLPPERIRVVPYAAAPGFAPVSDARGALAQLALPERFLLWVGALDPPDPRKGLEGLVAAVDERPGLPIVLAGRFSEPARALERPGRVRLLGRISDADLAALYSAADALVFPSLDEGYGLPAVEALACGTAVVAYAAGPLPEVLGDEPGATLVDAGDAAALLDAAERVAGSRAPAPTRAWSDVARETAAVYREAAG